MWTRVHCELDGVDVVFGRAFRPGGIHAQHHLDAVTVLLSHPEQIPAQHQIPGHGRMACVVGAALTNVGQLLQRLIPAPAGHFRIADSVTVFVKEEEGVGESPGGDVARAQREVTLQHLDRPRTELEGAILARLRAVLLSTQDARLGHPQASLGEIAVADQKRDLLGRAQAGFLKTQAAIASSALKPPA